ncbi:RNA polymerase subunit sigma-70 [Paractinoplanes maris]|uniref:RNA polymerase subunit sigma-70 n=1 Tax=Paractinoplanes maris TaxID=1734446 RepID=UPI002020F065|nr:RNA polymerase subunit sigma-70 [Actinoplanes maris]
MDQATLDQARGGDGDAFRTLTAPHERELLLHCYRMLGSLTEAEDALQETMLAAWRGLGGFEGRASLRTWLYRIATNRCLNTLRDNARRVPSEPVPPFPVPPPTRLSEVRWLQPYPDRLLDGVPEHSPGPDARYETREAVELAFVAALQRMPPRQAATLILRDVLGYPADEVAEMLGTTATAVKGALQRARAAVPAVRPGPRDTDDDVARRFATAFTAGDVDGVVALLTDDAWLSMPPAPHEYHGRPAIAAFLRASTTHAAGRALTLSPTRANGRPAFRATLDAAPAGIIVLTTDNSRIAAITRFHDLTLTNRF